MSDMNRRLLQVYSRVLGEDIWNQLAGEQDLHGPLLIEVPAAYHTAKVKLMVVGQQTAGWGHPAEHSIEDLLDQYRRFMGSLPRQSPFWQAADSIYSCLNPDGPPGGFLWSNLIKVDVRTKRPRPELEELICSTGLLQHEISITQPDAIVFFTGPGYDQRLRATFPGVKEQRVNDLHRLRHEELPARAFRSHHPRYLRQSGNRQVIPELKTLLGCPPTPPC